MEKEKIIKSMIITTIVLVIIFAAIAIAVHNSSGNTIIGKWETTAEDGSVVTYEFTKDKEKASSEYPLYYLTVKNKDGSTQNEKGTYVISNNTVITLYPADSEDTSIVSLKINKDKLTFIYTVDYTEKEIDFKKIPEKKS